MLPSSSFSYNNNPIFSFSSLPNKPISIIHKPIFTTLTPLSFTLRTDHTMASQSNPQSIHDFTVKDAKGNDVNLGDYKGKVLLIVNVASQCGLTNSNYTELTQLYDKYKSKGLFVLLSFLFLIHHMLLVSFPFYYYVSFLLSSSLCVI
jgi:glutathione peroxidase